jgi:hypothetical protein
MGIAQVGATGGLLSVAVMLVWQVAGGQEAGDVAFSGAEILLISGMLGCVISALGFVSRKLLALSEARAVRAEKLVDDLVKPITSTAETVEELAKGMTDFGQLIRDVLSNMPPSNGAGAGTRRR